MSVRYIGNPLLWLWRVRHRCGYGIHSPFAFRFVTEVVYESLPYYAYQELDALLPWKMRFRVKKCLHLFFRIANWWQPAQICAPSHSTLLTQYLKAACPQAQISHVPSTCTHFFFLDCPNNQVLPYLRQNVLLVLYPLHPYREWFNALPSVVSFDLYDVGIAFFDTKYYKQNYLINF